MSTNKPVSDNNGESASEHLASIKKVMKIDIIAFFTLMLLAILGIGITDTNADKAHGYWRYFMIIMAVFSTFWGLWRSRTLGAGQARQFMYQQTILWIAGFSAASVIYMLLGTGRLNYETTGLLMLLVIAFTTFVDGMLVSWKLYIIGAVLLLTLYLATYIESFLWIILIVSGILTALIIFITILKLRSM